MELCEDDTEEGTAPSNANAQAGVPAAAVGGAAIGFLILIIIAVVIIFLIWRRRKNKKKDEEVLSFAYSDLTVNNTLHAVRG